MLTLEQARLARLTRSGDGCARPCQPVYDRLDVWPLGGCRSTGDGRLTRHQTRVYAGGPWVSNGWQAYTQAIMQVYRDSQPAGKCGSRPLGAQTGCTPDVSGQAPGGQIVRVAVRPVFGVSIACLYEMHVERVNRVLRPAIPMQAHMQIRCNKVC